MDGKVTGLTSITPIMPDQTIITDRNGMNKPPVEIMPLPTNSFMSEDASAELLNNPFTLSLDIKGYNDGDANGGKTVARAAHTGRTALADDAVNGAMLNEAYTLSLGNEENVPIAAEIAREMSRMKNYEMLGKNAARQIYRMNPETGAAEDIQALLQNNVPAELMGEKVRSLLSRAAPAPQTEVVIQGDIKTNLPDMRGVVLTSPEMLQEEPGSPIPAALPGVRQDMSLLASLAAGRLSASDIEAILTLEPDLQEALLNMLSSINTSGTEKATANTPDEPAGVIYTPTTMQGGPADNTESAANTNQLTNALQGSLRQTFDDIVRLPNAPALKLTADLPDAAPAVALSNEELVRLTADSMIGGKVLSALSASTLRGSMQNLEKVNELPYALYIFGSVNPDKKGEFDEEGDIAVSEESGARKTRPSDFLRISEAIKMAAVLHNIYYGGSGRFPLETPWYSPYIRYAIKNNIIKNGEFGDVNDLATRAETAYIFSNCVPKAEFPIINYVSDIPDVSENIGYGDSIYLLHRAGVLFKNDKKSSYYPERMITKTEAASIIGRIATPGDRKRVLNI